MKGQRFYISALTLFNLSYGDETGLYYLQSRYYDPTTGRFINADHSTILKVAGNKSNGCNLFLYCYNDPVKNSDPSGYVAANIIGAVIGGIIGAVGGYFLANFLANKLNLRGWKRNVFVWGLTALIGAAAAVIGYFIGPYVAGLGVGLLRNLLDYCVGHIKALLKLASQ